MKYEFGNCRLIIDLPVGTYVPWPESASGKTRFKSLLDAMVSAGVRQNIATFTFDKNCKIEDIVKSINDDTISLVFLDRFDKYASKDIIEAINHNVGKKYIIMDLKYEDNARGLGYIDCDIEMISSSEVRLYDGDAV